MAATREPRRRGGSDLGARVAVAIPAIAFAIFIVTQGGEIFALGLLALGVLALGELYSLMGRVQPARLAGFLTLAALLAAALYGEPRHVVMVLVAGFPVTFLLAMGRPRREHVSWAIAATMFGVLWIGVAMAHAIWLRETPHGDGLVIGVLIGTFVGDTFAYFGGRFYGRTPLAPQISPNKTLEGLVAGFVGATLAVWFAGLYQDWLTGPHALLLGAVVAFAAPVGDLFESMIKRDLEVKDTGRLFGAHGGVLDRLDAALFTIPAAYYAAVALGYG
ncbi:MAG TPA: phosphatidate cytidylyltransferase [Thermoleophilaceae bacterium]|jgi:phosphatidate cytidylyltransferase|nr:phosphatidate cytidylyltransferase [Thermoleophilaceae bacterium]